MLTILRNASRLHRGQSGQVTVWVVIISFLLFGMMAFTADLGFWLVDRRHAQNQVDAAVLAGVQHLPAFDTELASAAAHDWLNRNHQDEVTSECVLDPPEYTFVDERGFVFGDFNPEVGYQKIRACVTREGALLFSSLLGVLNIRIPAVAAAGVLSTHKPYSLMAMNPDGCPGDGDRSMNIGVSTQSDGVILDAKDEDGNPQGGSSYTRSTCATALYMDGNQADMFTTSPPGTHDVRGGADGCASQPVEVCASPDPREGWGWIDDPWAGIPGEPFDEGTDCQAPPTIGGTDKTFALPPGTYCSLDIGGQRNTVVLSSGGVYVFKGEVLMGGNNTLTSQGNPVLIYMTCNPSPCGASVPSDNCVTGAQALFRTQGQSSLNLTGHPSYGGIAIFVDRTSGTDIGVRIAGGGQLIMNGGIYAICSKVEIEGGGSGTVAIDGSIIADKIGFKGNATYIVSASVTADAHFEMNLIE